jgi:adenylate kinase
VNAPADWPGTCGKCGGSLVARTDDGEDIVRERLKVYLRQTKPLVDYYSARGTLRTIDGDRPPDLVTAAVDAAVEVAARPGGSQS